jgi:hypothetical protein
MTEWLQGNRRMKRKAKVTDNEDQRSSVGVVHESKIKNIHIFGPLVQWSKVKLLP